MLDLTKWAGLNFVARLILSAQKVFKADLHLFFNLFIYLFIFGCACSSLCQGFLPLQGATLHCSTWASHCRGRGAQVLDLRASVIAAQEFSDCGSQALELHGFSSHSAWAYLPCGMWNLPTRHQTSASALARGFLPTAMPGKSFHLFFILTDSN